MTDPGGLLGGLRVVELATSFSGAHVGQLFADFGADVIVVERPGGSRLRAQAGFPFWARGKKSLVADLRDANARNTVKRLAAAADVLIETFRPGVADRLGLGFDQIVGVNPRLVYASISGFGAGSPLEHVKGYEGLVFAKVGGCQTFSPGISRDGPAFASVPYCSWSASQTALHGILAALYEREHSGLGQHIETDLVRAIAGHDPYGWLLHVLTDKYPDAFSAARPFTEDGPLSPLFAFVLVALSAEGHWLQFSQVGPHLFKALLHWLDLEWMLDDPEWAGVPVLDDQAKRNELWDLLLTSVRRRTVAEWQEIFERDRNVWAEVFRRGSELLEHPQLVHDRQVIEVADPLRGGVRQPNRLVRVDGQDFAGALAPELDSAEVGEPNPQPDGAEGVAGVHPSDAPLAGVTVLELGIWFAGPYGATLLTDLGARVIKVEPLEGDPVRSTLPFPEAGGARVTQGKESVAVDIRSPEGREVVLNLARRADIVLQSFRAGVAERLGVDAPTLRAANPELIYVNAPGYGVDGPCSDKPAFAPAIGAASGLAMRNLGASLEFGPDLSLDEVKANSVRLATVNYSAFASSDALAALGVATALLLGLLARRRGKGAHVLTASMLSTVAHALSEDTVVYDGRPDTPSPDDGLHGFHALYRLYPAARGWVFLAAPQQKEWQSLTTVLGSYTHHLDDTRFATGAGRLAHDGELASILGGIFATRTAVEWEQELTAADVGCVEVTEELPESFLQKDFGRGSGLLVDVVHPLFGKVPRLGPLVSFSRSALTPRAGRLIGQDTDAVLGELGYSTDEIARLRQQRLAG